MDARAQASETLSRRRREQGISLLEMLLVLVLIALAGALAAGAMTGGFEGVRLRAAAKDIAAQLRYTRALAIASGQPQRFVVDPQRHRWQAPNRRAGHAADSLRMQFTGAREAQPQEGEGGVLFFPDGASTGGRVQLQAGNTAWRIDVAWLTGRVNLARVEGEP
ncbi:MAG: GspH/FimT family pseudopilin [Pseudoxanthomonas sp.]